MGIKFYPHNPNREAAACRCGCGFDVMDWELVQVLKDLVDHFDVDHVDVHSWCRCKGHNAKIGGARRSQHLLGKAADTVVPGTPPSEVHRYLTEKYQDRYGVGQYHTFTHVDVRRGKARWAG